LPTRVVSLLHDDSTVEVVDAAVSRSRPLSPLPGRSTAPRGAGGGRQPQAQSKGQAFFWIFLIFFEASPAPGGRRRTRSSQAHPVTSVIIYLVVVLHGDGCRAGIATRTGRGHVFQTWLRDEPGLNFSLVAPGPSLIKKDLFRAIDRPAASTALPRGRRSALGAR